MTLSAFSSVPFLQLCVTLFPPVGCVSAPQPPNPLLVSPCPWLLCLCFFSCLPLGFLCLTVGGAARVAACRCRVGQMINLMKAVALLCCCSDRRVGSSSLPKAQHLSAQSHPQCKAITARFSSSKTSTKRRLASQIFRRAAAAGSTAKRWQASKSTENSERGVGPWRGQVPLPAWPSPLPLVCAMHTAQKQ